MKSKTLRTRASIGFVATLALAGLAYPATQATAVDTVASGDELTARLVSHTLSVSWSPKFAHPQLALVDERSGATLWQGLSTTGSASTPVDGSASVLVYGVVSGSKDLIGKVMAMVPDVGSSLSPAVAVVTDTGSHIAWDSNPSVSTWSVQNGAGAVLSTVTADTEVDLPYTLASGSDQVTITGDGLAGGVPTRMVSGFAIGDSAPHSTSGAAGSEAGSGSVPVITDTYLKYEAYIPFEYVNAPDMGTGLDCEGGLNGPDYWYSGDNRDLEYNTLKQRTLAMPSFDWVAKTTNGNRFVNPTKRYIRHGDGTYEYESQRTASINGLTIKATKNDGFMGSGTISHAIDNPYCASWNAIDYNETHDLWQTGAYYIRGKHDKMPRHQLYLTYERTDTYAPIELVFHHELTDPKCLNAAYETLSCPKWEYQYTK